MPQTRRLQLLSAFVFFATLCFVVGTAERGIDATLAVALAACIASAASFTGFELRARREVEIARMNRAPEY
ncbi:MAG: hypothetical protein H6719_21405 [Sandaracinaceae bacterium]|nr:hypothetical protein [Sandaracinaceae bacterium]